MVVVGETGNPRREATTGSRATTGFLWDGYDAIHHYGGRIAPGLEQRDATHTLLAGYTGLGVAASRFGAQVMLDLLAGEETERTRLRVVRERPVPFPPERLRYAGVQLTRWSLARADLRSGQRNAWLRTLDRLGLGFGS